MFEEVEVKGGRLKIPAMVPKLSKTPGRTDWAGGEVGDFNDKVYGGLLGLSADEMAQLKERGVI
jgi:crotonobetainyl-CoA:carnitine CoA-transferase CaiB-like acyl-CoA transferase